MAYDYSLPSEDDILHVAQLRAGYPISRRDFDALLNAGYGDLRYEWWHGRMYLMAPPSSIHTLLEKHTEAALDALLKDGGSCYSYRGKDVEIPPHPDEPDGATLSPDIVISCAPTDLSRRPEKGRVRSNIRYPQLIVEVLSEDSTAEFDRTGKFALYKQCPTLETYLLLSQRAAVAEVYRRETGWQQELYQGLNATIPLPFGDLALASIYRSVLPLLGKVFESEEQP